LTLRWIVLWQGLKDDFGAPSYEFQDHFSQFKNCVLTRVSYIDRANHLIRTLHQGDEPINEVVYITETARLFAIPIDREIFSLQGLHDEIADDASVLGMHMRPVRIKNTRHFDSDSMLAVVVEKQGFRATLPFIITRA
jgi:hypothetical protein